MESLKEREKKIGDWLKNHQGILIILVAAILLAIRLYYFFITLNQPVWWDEGDYLNIARQWAFGSPAWDINPLRPLLFPLIVAVIFKIGLGEFFVRLIPFLASIISIILLYCIGKDLYDRKTGLVSAFMLAIFWSFLFFSYRMLVDVLVAMFWLLGVFLFIRGYEQGKKAYLWLCIPVIVLGFLMKYTGSLLGFILVTYLLVVYRLKPLKNKDLWMSMALGIVTIIPFLWYEWKKFGHPLAFYISSIYGRAPSPRSQWQTLIDYIKTTIPHIETAFLILFVLGLLIMLFELVIGLDLLWKNKDKKLKAHWLMTLMIAVPFLYIVSLGYGAYIEERYLFIMYPFMFIIGARALWTISDYTKKYNKIVAAIIVIGFLAFGFYENVKHGDAIINQKKVSFLQVKEAAEWVKANSKPGEVIFIFQTQAEFQYAANRRTVGVIGRNETELLENIKEMKPKFVIINVFVPVGEEQAWKVVYPYVKKEIFKPEMSYGPYVDKEEKLPALTIFSINPEFYGGKN